MRVISQTGDCYPMYYTRSFRYSHSKSPTDRNTRGRRDLTEHGTNRSWSTDDLDTRIYPRSISSHLGPSATAFLTMTKGS